MAVSNRVRVRRGANSAVYERAQIDEILDANLVCHVGFTVNGEARIIPTAYVRIDDAIYLHGNRRNQMMNALLDGQTACISVLQLDGLVLARSGFHHSVNYRSVVLFGTVTEVGDKIPYLDAFIDKLVPGRSADLRVPTDQELNATLLLKLSIQEASAKVRTGPPLDDEKDIMLDTWAGVLPLTTRRGPPEPCPLLPPGAALPAYLQHYATSSD